ncbi:unnamed protein product [Rhizophagus irregularis]|uniref:Uncharacterized protein n=1 Tax=Rhizophagus irregularis TaxID=588596 RepID=A0A2N1NZ93_9GLOM|nr:hypothetical protein RhiirC2_842805 [Rhizophagus irregularis]CAB4394759.1 unnamed protein product [Rhizophagus irregularis]CAB5365160.1 unnamed protein product [Rhizophagus irregularis]
MKFKQYSLQILVNGFPLEECWELLNDDNHEYHESSSYVRDEITQLKYESGTIHYAAVNVNHGTRFSVRFSAEDATKDQPIKAYLSVDGNWDFTYYQLTDEKFRKENGFWNKDRNKKYYFKFIPTTQSASSPDSKLINNTTNIDNKELNDNKFSLKKSGGLGCVSVYFYRAKWVNHGCKVPNFNINQTLTNKDVGLLVGFDEEFHEQNYDIQTGIVNLKRISKKPIAELHLHYRDISCLIDRGFDFPNLSTPKNDIVRDDYFEDIFIKERTELIESVQSNMISSNYYCQTDLIDKDESNLIKEGKLDKMFSNVEKSNKRSFHLDEKCPSKKRAKDNFYILNTTVQSDNILDDNFKVGTSQSVVSQFNNDVTEAKLTKNANTEEKNLESRISSMNTLQQMNSFSNVIIIEDSDDNNIPLYIENNPLIVLSDNDSFSEEVKSSKPLQQDQMICLSEEELVRKPHLRKVKKRKNKNLAHHNFSNSSKFKVTKPVYDVIILSD